MEMLSFIMTLTIICLGLWIGHIWPKHDLLNKVSISSDWTSASLPQTTVHGLRNDLNLKLLYLKIKNFNAGLLFWIIFNFTGVPAMQ